MGAELLEILEKDSEYSCFMIFHHETMQGYYSKQGLYLW